MAGSIHKFETPGGRTRYRARYRDASGKQHEKRFEKMTAARLWLNAQTSAVHTGSHVAPAQGLVTVGTLIEAWFASKVKLEISTRHRYSVVIRMQIKPTWSDVRINAVTHAKVSAWVVKLSERDGLAASTVRQAHTILHQVFDFAIRNGYLAANPATNVDLPKLPQPKQVFLSHDQIDALVEAAGPYADAVLTLATLGLRFGELSALTCGDLDVERRRLHVEHSASQVNGQIVITDTKSGRKRWVPVPGYLVEALAARAQGRAADDLLFTTERGTRLLLSNWDNRIFGPAMKAAGITADLTTHGLRHTAASMAISDGAHVMHVQRLLGHRDTTTTTRIYAHILDDDLDALARRQDDSHRRRREGA